MWVADNCTKSKLGVWPTKRIVPMKTALRELKRVRYLIVFWLFLLHVIPSMVAGEETPVPNTSTQLKSRLKTVVVADYYPYTFVNNEGVPDGFSVDLANAVAKVMGMDLEIKVDTWERAIRRLETGEIDFLPMMAYSKERDNVFDFSAPHTIAFDAFFTRKDNKRINSIEELKGQTVIVMKGDQAHDYLRSSGFVDSEHIILVDSLPEALRLLSSEKGDAALMPKLVGLTLINDLNLTNLTQSPVVVESYNRPFSFAVKDGDLLFLERLNQGLNIVKKTGQYREIYNKCFGALEPKELSLKSVSKYIIGAILALLLINSTRSMLLTWIKLLPTVAVWFRKCPRPSAILPISFVRIKKLSYSPRWSKSGKRLLWWNQVSNTVIFPSISLPRKILS